MLVRHAILLLITCKNVEVGIRLKQVLKDYYLFLRNNITVTRVNLHIESTSFEQFLDLHTDGSGRGQGDCGVGGKVTLGGGSLILKVSQPGARSKVC